MTITLNLKQVIKSVLYTLCGLAAVKFRGYLYWPIHSWQSPLRHLAGPQNDSFLFGHLIKLANEQGSTMYEEWVQKYGKTFRYRGFLGSYQLFTTDPRAIQFILLQQNTFHRPDATRRSFAMLLGEGLLSVDLEAHKRQRRIMSPSFGALQIRMLVPIFFEKSNMLRDHWIGLIHNNYEGEVIDVLEGLNLATLDIIGTAGFGYEFNSFEHDVENELARAFKQMFDSGKDITFMMVVKGFMSLLLGIPTAAAAERDANIETMRRIGTKIIQEKKELAKQSGEAGAESGDRDLLTLLIKSNMVEASNNIHRNQAMSDEEVLGRKFLTSESTSKRSTCAIEITTFLVAGHETSGTTIAWALYALTKHPNVQSRLRHELLNAGLGNGPSMAELDKLSYLDYVVRETLRVYPAVPNVGREAAEDTVIPANESFTNRRGEKQKEIKIQKGDNIMIPILAMNRAKEVWGDDAMDFRPERWYELPQAVKEIPGVWGNLMTFAHGTYGCIGYRFAVAEIKAILYSLIRSIEFEIDPGVEIEGKTGLLVTRPCVISDPPKGNRMPLRCRSVGVA